MWSTVELREIRVLLTLAEELHFGRTADRLTVTPSRVSQTVRALEARVGGRLFDRTSRRVRLTPLGEQLVGALAPLYAQMEQAFAAARAEATGIDGTLRLGLDLPILGGPHLDEIVDRFEKRHPSCRVTVVDAGYQRSALERLRSDELDLAAVRLPLAQPDIALGTVLSYEARVALVAADHPLAARPEIGYDELAGETVQDIPSLPRETVDDFVPPVTPSGRRLRRAHHPDLAASLRHVARGELVHVSVPSVFARWGGPGIVMVPIADLPPSRSGLAWLRWNPSPKVRAFEAAARDVVAGHDRAAADAPPGPRPGTGPGLRAR